MRQGRNGGMASSLNIQTEILQGSLDTGPSERLGNQTCCCSLLLVLLSNNLGVTHGQESLSLNPVVALHAFVRPLDLVNVFLGLGVLLSVDDGIRDQGHCTLSLAFLGI